MKVMAKNTAKTAIVVIEMNKTKDCKGSVRFDAADPTAIVNNTYVSREMEGIGSAKKIRVTVEVVE